jgi:MoxR-like ATPase
VIPEDVRELAVPVLAHRVLPRAEGDRSGEGAALALQELLWELPAPG